MLKKLGTLLIVLSFAVASFAQETKTAEAMPPALPNPNAIVNDDPTHGAIIQTKDKKINKKIKKTKKAKKTEKNVETEAKASEPAK